MFVMTVGGDCCSYISYGIGSYDNRCGSDNGEGFGGSFSVDGDSDLDYVVTEAFCGSDEE